MKKTIIKKVGKAVIVQFIIVIGLFFFCLPQASARYLGGEYR